MTVWVLNGSIPLVRNQLSFLALADAPAPGHSVFLLTEVLGRAIGVFSFYVPTSRRIRYDVMLFPLCHLISPFRGSVANRGIAALPAQTFEGIAKALYTLVDFVQCLLRVAQAIRSDREAILTTRTLDCLIWSQLSGVSLRVAAAIWASEH